MNESYSLYPFLWRFVFIFYEIALFTLQLTFIIVLKSTLFAYIGKAFIIMAET